MKNKYLIFLGTIFLLCLAVVGCKGGESHVHSLEHVAKVEATCTEDGNIEYWYCEDCDKYFSDEACTTEVGVDSLKVAKLGHNLVHIAAKEPTPTEVGWYAYDTCTRCDYTTYQEKPFTGHIHTLTHHEEVSPTCLAEGVKEYWECEECHECFGDANAVNELTDLAMPKVDHIFDDKGYCSHCGHNESLVKYLLMTPDDSDPYYILEYVSNLYIGDLTILSEYNVLPVKQIGGYAFSEVTGVYNLVIPASVEVICEDAFYYAALNSITFEEGSNLKTLDEYAFQGVYINSLVLPSGLKTIDDNAFEDSSIAHIYIPDSVEYIGEDAFDYVFAVIYCELESAPDTWNINWNLGNLSVVWDYKNNDTDQGGNIIATIDGITYTIYNNEAFLFNVMPTEEVVIPSSITYNGNTYPVTSIEEYAFYNANDLLSIYIPASVESIDNYALDGIYRTVIYLEADAIPSGFGEYWNDNGLPIVLDYKNNKLDTNGYEYVVVDNLRYAIKDDEASVVGSNPGKVANIPASINYDGKEYVVKSIGEDAFCYDIDLEEVVFASDSQLELIDESAFASCIALEGITLPQSLVTINYGAFGYCKNLKYVVFESGSKLENLGTRVFEDCYNLESITIPFIGSNKTTLENSYLGYLFDSSSYEYNGYIVPSNLKELILLDTETLVSNTFYSCYNLCDIYLPSTLTTVESNVFYNNRKLVIHYEGSQIPDTWASD